MYLGLMKKALSTECREQMAVTPDTGYSKENFLNFTIFV
jgi:hypothetical protein